MEETLGSPTDLRHALAEMQGSRDEAVARYETIVRERDGEKREAVREFRNALAVIRAIARRTLDETDNVEAYFGLFEGRLAAYSRAQSAIMRDGAKGLDLQLLIHDELVSQGLATAPITMTGESARLLGQAAGTLAMVFHELVCRLIASDKIEATSIALRICRAPQAGADGLLVEWKETFEAGEPALPSDEQPVWIEQAVAHQLKGTVSYEAAPSALKYRFWLPQDCYIVP